MGDDGFHFFFSGPPLITILEVKLAWYKVCSGSGAAENLWDAPSYTGKRPDLNRVGHVNLINTQCHASKKCFEAKWCKWIGPHGGSRIWNFKIVFKVLGIFGRFFTGRGQL